MPINKPIQRYDMTASRSALQAASSVPARAIGFSGVASDIPVFRHTPETRVAVSIRINAGRAAGLRGDSPPGPS